MRLSAIVVFGLALQPALAGSIYKWTDSRGQVHYGQTPPDSGAVEVQPRLQGGITLTTPDKAAPATAPGAKSASPTPPAAPVETAAAKATRCRESAERLRFLEESTPRRLFTTAADGTESRMTEEEFDARVAKAREAGKGC